MKSIVDILANCATVDGVVRNKVVRQAKPWHTGEHAVMGTPINQVCDTLLCVMYMKDVVSLKHGLYTHFQLCNNFLQDVRHATSLR